MRDVEHYSRDTRMGTCPSGDWLSTQATLNERVDTFLKDGEITCIVVSPSSFWGKREYYGGPLTSKLEVIDLERVATREDWDEYHKRKVRKLRKEYEKQVKF